MIKNMGKIVKAVAPYRHQGIINFKKGAYDAWIKEGGLIESAHYLPKQLIGWSYNHELPLLPKNKIEARLRFVEPISRKFDAFPDYVRYEIIPMIWDCWPCLDDRICSWLKKHKVKTAIFTSRQNAERIQKRFPEMQILVITEGIDTSKYHVGKELKDREIDLLEFGRGSNLNFNVNANHKEKEKNNDNVNVNENLEPGTGCTQPWNLEPAVCSHETANQPVNSIRYVCTKVNGKFIYSDGQLFETMGNAKVTIALPRCETDAAIAGDVETLTQRYWECMLSRMVMVGHAPKELTDLIGYNPVIEIDRGNITKQLQDILARVEDYQELVDKNRETALKLGDWTIRMQQVMEWLKVLGYEIAS